MELRTGQDGETNSKKEEINWKTTSIKLRRPTEYSSNRVKTPAVFILQEHTDFAVFQACFRVFSWRVVAEPVIWGGVGEGGEDQAGRTHLHRFHWPPAATQGLCLHL